MRKIIPYNSNLVMLARQLRNNSTPAEIALWKKLRNKQLLGYDFDRQKPLGNYIVDFYCYNLKLVIEIDGISHTTAESKTRDINKQQFLEAQGLRIIRFTEFFTYTQTDSVIQQIADWIANNNGNPPQPLPRGENN